MSGQDKVAAGAQPHTKEDQEANSSATVAEGQQEKLGHHKYEDVSVVCADAWYWGCFAPKIRLPSAICVLARLSLHQLVDVDADCSCKRQASILS